MRGCAGARRRREAGSARGQRVRALAGCLAAAAILGSAAVAQEGPPPDPRLTEAIARAQASPGDAEAQHDLGVLCYEADRLEDATAAFRRAVAIDSTHVPALVNLGVALIDLGRAEESLAHLARAVRLSPDDVSALTNLAIARYSLGDIEAAVGGLVQAIELDPGNQVAHFHLGIAFAEAQLYEEAVREWQAVTAADPDSPAGIQATRNIERVESILKLERASRARRSAGAGRPSSP
jgi:tetratricopeptide (TPR) repeat protein